MPHKPLPPAGVGPVLRERNLNARGNTGAFGRVREYGGDLVDARLSFDSGATYPHRPYGPVACECWGCFGGGGTLTGLEEGRLSYPLVDSKKKAYAPAFLFTRAYFSDAPKSLS